MGRHMSMRCGICRTAVDETAGNCPACGAPRSIFREAELGFNVVGDESGHAPPNDASLPASRFPGTRARVAIAVVVIAALATGYIYYSKHSYLENQRRRCIEVFAMTQRCDCITNEIDKNAYAISFLRWPRVLAALTRQNLDEIYREASMTCVQPR
jgi:hypothetical protein